MLKRLLVISMFPRMAVACSDRQPVKPSPQPSPEPVVVTVEVTRQVEITPQPQATLTPIQIIVTRLVEVPTPTRTAAPTASGCLATARTQQAMNACSAKQQDDANRRMKNLFTQILGQYQDKPQDAMELSKLQSEWENWAQRECDFRWLDTGLNQSPLFRVNMADRGSHGRTGER